MGGFRARWARSNNQRFNKESQVFRSSPPVSIPSRTLAAMILATGLAFTPAAVDPAFGASGAPSTFADLTERLSPAVVNISTAHRIEAPEGGPQLPPGGPFEDLFKDFFDQLPQQRGPRSVQSLGSGFVISADGFIVTNNHVIEEADEITANFPDGTSLDATLIGRDPKTDIALLKVESETALPFVSFGDSDASRVGDWVLAIGNPFGLGGSVSAGIISARNRDINAGPYDDFIQTDAAINRGNSGGPLFNMEGEVIGVNTAIISPTGGSIGIGFAVPSTLAKNVVAQLREFGETRRGWLGVRIQTVTDELAEGLGLEKPSGALVAGVSEGGPAAAAGIETGDVVLRFDGKDVVEMRDLPRIVAETPVGESVRVVIWRDGQTQTVLVEVGLLDEGETRAVKASDESGGDQVESLGMTLVRLTDGARARFGVDREVVGVLVAEVAEGSPAAEKGVRAGDVLVEVAQEEVHSPDEALEKIEAAREAGARDGGGAKPVILLLNSGGDLRFVGVPFDE